jgi:hypothetical protein
MAAKKKGVEVKGCNCVEQVNAQLKERNVALTTSILMDFGKGKASVSPPQLMAHKIDSDKKKTKVPVIFAMFCPFCGKKYPE